MGVTELAVVAPCVVIEAVLNPAKTRLLKIVLVGRAPERSTQRSCPGEIGVDIHEREIVDAGIEIGDLGAKTISFLQQRLLEQVHPQFPVVRLLGLEERIGIEHLAATAMGAAAHEHFGHRRRTPATSPAGIDLHPVDTGSHRDAEGGREAALLLFFVKDQVGLDTLKVLTSDTPWVHPGGDTGFARQAITVIA
ncbi:hypothetical protein D3C80_841230 [compost metagenome]